MPDYKELYFILFRELTKVVFELENRNYGNAEALIKRIQQESEERYLKMDDGISEE